MIRLSSSICLSKRCTRDKRGGIRVTAIYLSLISLLTHSGFDRIINALLSLVQDNK